MRTLNHQLSQTIIDSDGRFLSNSELQPLESYVESYQKRLNAYQLIAQHSDTLVLSSLKKFAHVHPEIIQRSGKRCRYDMSQVLKSIAVSILLDDEFMFREKMMFWLDTMLRAHQKQGACSKAYRYLDESIRTSLPTAAIEQVSPYIDIILETMQPYT